MTSLSRRDFIETMTGVSLLAGSSANQTEKQANSVKTPFVGIHIAAHSFYDEGIDHCLDFLRETAGVNALLISSSYYYGAMIRPKEVMGNHDVPPRDNRNRKLSRVYFKFNDGAYAGTSLRHRGADPDAEYAGREIFADLAGPARRRDMKLFERMYEPTSQALGKSIRNGERVLARDLTGRPDSKPCWNHPEFRTWIVAAISDLFKTYPLDGLQYGAERVGPLSRLLYRGNPPTCFCEHCEKRGREHGLDMGRVRRGFQRLHEFIHAQRQGADRPSDGVFTTLLGVLIEYPEILAWEREQLASAEEIHKSIFNAVRAIRPGARVGRHVDHAQSSWDLIYRAAVPPARMAETCDFIKPILYHEIIGPRLRNSVLEELKKGPLRELALDQSLALYYALVNYDPAAEPKLDELNAKGFSPEYVRRETRRFVEGVSGRCAVYAGIGTDIPKGSGWGTQAWPSDTESVYRAAKGALEAGAGGVVVCREYEENRRESLQAVGRAVREWKDS